MAQADEIADFRLLIAEPDETVYTDEQLSLLLDSAVSTDAAAAKVWTQKAAAAATLVNVSESGSSRSLGDLQKNALSMASQFAKAVGADAGASPGVRISRIKRP